MKWKDFDDTHNAWVAKVKLNCDRLLQEFDQSNGANKRRLGPLVGMRSKKVKLSEGKFIYSNGISQFFHRIVFFFHSDTPNGINVTRKKRTDSVSHQRKIGKSKKNKAPVMDSDVNGVEEMFNNEFQFDDVALEVASHSQESVPCSFINDQLIDNNSSQNVAIDSNCIVINNEEIAGNSRGNRSKICIFIVSH